MTAAAGNNAVAAHRRRLKRDGLVRLEVKVRKEDASLVRDLVDALGDPLRGNEARALLRERIGGAGPMGLKALLAAAPLEDIDLERSRDPGRPVDL